MSFKRAADELGVTPTAISHQIRLLERYCGCALFRRRPRPLSLTEAGARLFAAIRGGLGGFATAIAAVKQDRDRQPLRVTTTNAFASRWLVPRLPAWRKLHPDVPLEIIGTDSVLDLQAGDGDVAIRYATGRVMLSTGRLKWPADLVNHALIHCYWSPADREPPTWQRWLAAAQSKWRHVPNFKDVQHLSFREELHAIEAVIAGQGVGIFSDVLVARELATGTLVKAFDLKLPGYSFYAIRRAEHPREKVIQAFIGWLRTAC